MPAFVKTPEDERLWAKAKAQAEEAGHKEDWAYVTGIYKKMKGGKVAMGSALTITHEPRKGYSFIVSGGDIDELARELNLHMVARVPGPMTVPRVRGAVKAFWLHWSNAQAKWDSVSWKDFPWQLDGAGFIVFCGREALSPLGKPWSNAEMNYVARKLHDHPGYGNSPESAMGRRRAKERIPGGLSKDKSPSDFDPKAVAKGQKVEMEHTTDAEVAREIARDHLTEDPAYYDKLERMESGEYDKKAAVPQKAKDKVDALLKRYEGKEVPDDEVHAIAEDAGISPHDLESYVYSLASKYVTKQASRRVACRWLRRLQER